jgi:hypothetical protein
MLWPQEHGQIKPELRAIGGIPAATLLASRSNAPLLITPRPPFGSPPPKFLIRLLTAWTGRRPYRAAVIRLQASGRANVGNKRRGTNALENQAATAIRAVIGRADDRLAATKRRGPTRATRERACAPKASIPVPAAPRDATSLPRKVRD